MCFCRYYIFCVSSNFFLIQFGRLAHISVILCRLLVCPCDYYPCYVMYPRGDLKFLEHQNLLLYFLIHSWMFSVSNQKLAAFLEAQQVSSYRTFEWISNLFSKALWGMLFFHLFQFARVFGAVLLCPSQASSVDSCMSSCWFAERLQSPNSLLIRECPLMGWQRGAHGDMPRLVPNCSLSGSNPTLIQVYFSRVHVGNYLTQGHIVMLTPR